MKRGLQARVKSRACNRSKCLALRGMQDAERASAVGPDQHQRIAVLGNAGERFLHVGGGMHGVAVDFRDHLTTLQTGVICRTARRNLFDNGSVNVITDLQLLTKVGSEIGEAKTPARFTVISIGAFAVGLTFVKCLERDWQILGLTIAQSFDVKGGSGLILLDCDL